jgi:hypothetical protein
MGILAAIEAMKFGRAAGIRIGCSRAIQLRLQPRSDSVVRFIVRPAAAGRRHRASPQLDDNLFPRLCRVGHLLGIRLVEHQVAGLQFLVVTRDAISGDELARRSCRCRHVRRRRLLSRRGHSPDPCDAHANDEYLLHVRGCSTMDDRRWTIDDGSHRHRFCA